MPGKLVKNEGPTVLKRFERKTKQKTKYIRWNLKLTPKPTKSLKVDVHGEKCIFTHIYSWKLWHPYRVDAEKQILIKWINILLFLCLKMKKTTKIWGLSGPSPQGHKQWNYFAVRLRTLKLTYYSSSISANFGFIFSYQSSYSRYMWSSLIAPFLVNLINWN